MTKEQSMNVGHRRWLSGIHVYSSSYSTINPFPTPKTFSWANSKCFVPVSGVSEVLNGLRGVMARTLVLYTTTVQQQSSTRVQQYRGAPENYFKKFGRKQLRLVFSRLRNRGSLFSQSRTRNVNMIEEKVVRVGYRVQKRR